MRDLGKPAGRRAADALRRGIRIRVFRMRGFECAQLTLHHIIFVIRNLRCIFVIIFFVVIPQLFSQCGNLPEGIHASTPSHSNTEYSIPNFWPIRKYYFPFSDELS